MSGIAIIIPVLNDTTALGSLLRGVREWATQPAEVIVVTGAADSRIDALCRTLSCALVRSEPCRGAQLDDGARAASAHTLWFLHADAAPIEASLAAIDRARAGGAEAGYFRFKFSGPRCWQKSLLETLVQLRTRLGGVAYGDQGLWVDRTAYRDCGGFAREPLFEEVRLFRRLKARSRIVPLSEPIGVAPRRWERDGWLTRSVTNRLLALGFALGIPAARLAASYDAETELAEDPHP